MSTESSWGLPARRLADLLAAGECSAVEVLEAHLERIAAVNPAVNAIVTLDADGARHQASALDDARRHGRALGPLHGLPIAIKDLEDAAGLRTTYGSPLFAEHVPATDGTLARRLRRAGAVIVGKTNTPEFGAGSQTFNRVFGATRNPHDLRRTPGGSSGGAAAAVATGMLPFADGSDLAASVRNPAAFCGVVGLRPSVGCIPDAVTEGDPWGSLAVLGPIARSVDDAALLLGALSGEEPDDPRSVPAPAGLGAPVLARGPRGLRLAFSPTLGDLPLEPAVRAATGAARDRLVRAGWDVTEAEPDLRPADACFDTLRAVGFATATLDMPEAQRAELKDTVQWNRELGLSLDGAAVARAQRDRGVVVGRMRRFMADYDALVLPTVQVEPFDVELDWVRTIDNTPMEHYVAWLRSCSRITVTGHPAVSVPAGRTAAGLPFGLQIVGRHRGERALLELAAGIERDLADEPSPAPVSPT